MLKLANPKIVGAGEHRSGWPYVLECLAPLFSDDGEVIFDDFVERTFLYNNKWHNDDKHLQPWVGVLHHPPDIPHWYMPELHLQRLLAVDRFQESLPYLRMIVSMGEPLTSWLRQQWPTIPVLDVRHPTGRPLLYWTPEKYKRNRYPMLLQVGWFLRNTASIYQCPKVNGLSKTHLHPPSPWANYAAWLCKRVMTKHIRPHLAWDDTVVQMPKQTDAWYDVVLSENVVFVDLITAVANNTVVECIARNTPLVVNRHPGPVSYLGADYPLFFDDLAEVPALVTEERIMAAHQHLRQLDKWWIRGPLLCEQLGAACVQHIPELAGSTWHRKDLVDCTL